MKMATACDALMAGRCLEVRYHGYTRVVEVHTCGTTSAGQDAMRVWQVRGGSVSNEPVGWKILRFDDATEVCVLDEKSLAPRMGYRKDDKAFARIVAQL